MQSKLKLTLIGLLAVNIILLALVLYEAFTGNCKPVQKTPGSRIVGGFPANIRHYRYVAALMVTKHVGLSRDRLQCGCAIIATRWAVTAAHCIILLRDFPMHTVRVSAGSTYWRKGHKHKIANWISHPKYMNETMVNDIGMIKVQQPFKKENEGKIPIASPTYIYKTNKKVRVLGWGLTYFTAEDTQSALNAVDVFIIQQSKCTHMYGEQLQAKLGERHLISKTMFCAGTNEGGKDACTFDSGGPIVEKGLLIGIVSWGLDCGLKDQPGVYTRINLYRRWIIKVSKKYKAPLHITDLSNKKKKT